MNTVPAVIPQSEPDLWFSKAVHPGSICLCETLYIIHRSELPICIYNHIISIPKTYTLTNSYYSNLKCPQVEGTIITLPSFRRRKKTLEIGLLFFFFPLNKSLKAQGFSLFLEKSIWQESSYLPITRFSKPGADPLVLLQRGVQDKNIRYKSLFVREY